MASTVYYGKSDTAANVAVKIVTLVNESDFDINQLEIGDLLVVHFVNENMAEGVSLSLKIGDSNKEISTATDVIYNVNNPSPTPVVKGAWVAGEVVTFAYTASGTNAAHWTMVDSAPATYNTFGEVKLADKDDLNRDGVGSDAITVDGVKRLIQVSKWNLLKYEKDASSGTQHIGDLSLVSEDEATSLSTVKLYAPAQVVYSRKNPADGGTEPSLVYTGDMHRWNNIPNGTVTTVEVDGGAGIGVQGSPITKSGTITVSLLNSGVKSGNYGPGSSRTLNFEETFTVPYIEVDKTGRITKAVTYGMTLPKETTPAFKIVPIYTKNIFYAAGATKPSNIYYNGAHGSDAANTYMKGSDGITVDQLIHVQVPEYSGFQFIGVTGYNVNQAGPKSSGSNYEHRIPGDINVWCCAPGTKVSGKYTRVWLEMTNLASTTNCVYLTIFLLYANGSVG